MIHLQTFEGLFSSKPTWDIEIAKKDALKAARSFVERNAQLKNPKDLTDEQVIEMIKGFAKSGKDKHSSQANKQAFEFWKQFKHLFK